MAADLLPRRPARPVDCPTDPDAARAAAARAREPRRWHGHTGFAFLGDTGVHAQAQQGVVLSHVWRFAVHHGCVQPEYVGTGIPDPHVRFHTRRGRPDLRRTDDDGGHDRPSDRRRTWRPVVRARTAGWL